MRTIWEAFFWLLSAHRAETSVSHSAFWFKTTALSVIFGQKISKTQINRKHNVRE